MSHQLSKLSDADLKQLAAALRVKRLTAPFSSVAIQRVVSSAVSQGVATELQQLAELGFSNEQLVVTIELLVNDRKQRPPTEDVIDLVTTGPEVAGVTNRDTSVVVRELFAHATESVLIAGYAVYQGQRVFEALARRMEEIPELDVKMFLDIQRSMNDSTDSGELVRRFARRFRDQQWPKDARLPQVYYYPQSLDLAAEKRSCLHAKCVAVDDRQVFISSANFTEAAHDRNIEVGLLIRSPSLAGRISWHFNALVADGQLKPVL